MKSDFFITLLATFGISSIDKYLGEGGLYLLVLIVFFLVLPFYKFLQFKKNKITKKELVKFLSIILAILAFIPFMILLDYLFWGG